MLTIRDPQMRALSIVTEERFLRRLADDLRARFPQACTGLGAGLAQLVRFALDDARAFGLRSERGVACYAYLVLLLGPDFAEGGEPRAILEDQARPENNKIAALFLHCKYR